MLRIGDLVELHVSYNDTWSRGFAVAEVVPGGYRVRRLEDRSLLPGVTSPEDLRTPPAPWGLEQR